MRCSDGSASGNSWRCGLCAEYQEQAKPWQIYSGVLGSMFRGNRLLIIAVGIVLSGAQPPQEQPKSQASAQPTEQAATQDYAPNPGPCYQAKNYNAADLCAQWRSAIASEKAAHEARRSSNWSIVATILSALSLIAVAAALYLTVISNNIARDTAQKQLRAYMGTLGAVCDSKIDAAHLIIDIKNFGASPAHNLLAVTNVSIFRKSEAGSPSRINWFDSLGNFGQCEPTHSQTVTVILDKPIAWETMRLLLCETTLTFEDIFGKQRWRRITYAVTELTKEINGKIVMDIWQNGNHEGEGSPPLSGVNAPAV